MSAGKGDIRRPTLVPEADFEARWAAAFGTTKPARGMTPAEIEQLAEQPVYTVVPPTETRAELNARCERELGISYDELERRSARVQAGEGIPHAEAMRLLDDECDCESCQ